MNYRPQRWLPSNHPLYDRKFVKDDLKGFPPFSLGPRMCPGKEIAWMEGRLFVAKVLWTFDVLKVPGQNIDLEGKLRHWGFFDKPELKVSFVPVKRLEM
jgi:cytochrome P450